MLDELKACGTAEVRQAYVEGHAWVLLKTSEVEARVRRRPLEALPQLLKEGAGACELLRLWQAPAGGGRAVAA